jgi:hypothetical protein
VSLDVGALYVLESAALVGTAVHAKGCCELRQWGNNVTDVRAFLVLVVEEHVSREIIAATDNPATLTTRSVLQLADLSTPSEK